MHTFKKTAVLFLALMGVFSFMNLPAYGEGVVFVQDGRAACVVVMGEDDGISRSHTHRRSDTAIGLGPGVTPGEYYYFEAHVKNLTEPEDGTGVNIQLDWLDEEDRWLRERVTRRVEGFGEWVKADAVVKAPAEASTVVVLVNISSLPPGTSVHIDDVVFKKIAVSD